MKKYKIRKDGRIQALRDIPGIGVKKGDIGGYVESEANLSHEGGAWVSGDARVSGGAEVYGGARVSGGAWVHGRAHIYGDAEIYGGAEVHGGARIYGRARIYEGARIYGRAWVHGGAEVYGVARIYGDAEIYGGAEVYGGARIYGDAEIYGSARVYGDLCLGFCPVFVGSHHPVSFSGLVAGVPHVSIGCVSLSLSEWSRKYRTIGKEHDYSEEQIDEYGYYLSIIDMILKREGVVK